MKKKGHQKILTVTLSFILLSLFSNAQTANWQPLGPFIFPANEISQINGIGRVSQIKFDPVNALRMYAVAPHGVFISNDTADTWTPLKGTDNLPTGVDCASICIDWTNTNILYLGTGDANFPGSGSGIWKSVDGGASFTQSTGIASNLKVIEILMSPANHNVLVAACNWGSGVPLGIYQSTDAGATWSLTLSSGYIGGLCFNAAPNSSILYAVSNNTETFYSSADFGTTWNTVTLSTTLPSNGGRIAVTAANPLRVYVSFVGSNSQGGQGGIVYKSDDGGNTFSLQKGDMTPNLGGYTGDSYGQGNYNFAIVGDPLNADILYCCAHVIWKSSDAGVNWVQEQATFAGVLHTDQHWLVFNPHNYNQLFNANDGGVFINRDQASTNTWLPKSNGLAATEFYSMANSHLIKSLIDGGTQDNGEVYYNTNNTNAWHTIRAGDVYGPEFFDLTNAGNVYYPGFGYRQDTSTAGYINQQYLNLPGGKFSYEDLYALSYQDGNTCFYAQNNEFYPPFSYTLYRTTSLQATPPSWVQESGGSSGLNPSKQMIAMAVAPTNANVLYILSFDRSVYMSNNALSSSPVFTTVTSIPQPAGSNIELGSIAPLTNGAVYISGAGYVFRSVDQGTTWTPVGSGPVTDMMQNQEILKLITDTSQGAFESLYAITNQAVYYKDNNNMDWSFFTTNLPTIANLTDLDIYYDTTNINNSLLRVSTYGRGVWESKLALSATLPLKLLSISVVSNANNNVVLWQTAQEFNSKEFEIERSDINGNSFYSIGTDKAKGAYSGAFYFFNDLNVQQNTDYYYRLKMIDIDSHFQYSPVVHARYSGHSNAAITVAPNPVTNNEVHINLISPSQQHGQLQIADISGQILLKQELQVTEGLQILNIDIHKLSKGTYIIRVFLDNGILLTRRFIKQ